jgi:hypothetical protein
VRDCKKYAPEARKVATQEFEALWMQTPEEIQKKKCNKRHTPSVPIIWGYFLEIFYGISMGFCWISMARFRPWRNAWPKPPRGWRPSGSSARQDLLEDAMGIYGGFSWDLSWIFSWDIPENYGKLPRSHETIPEFMDIPSGKLLHNELERSTMLFSWVNLPGGGVTTFRHSILFLVVILLRYIYIS